jgi:histidinol dehydrogenase
VTGDRLSIARLDSASPGFDAALDALLAWDVVEDDEVSAIVRDVIREVRQSGDAAVLEYTRRFDRLDRASVADLALTEKDFAAAWERTALSDREALQTAAARIRAYHEHQRETDWEYTDELGCRLGQKVTPLERVGIYVPGGRASYPSTVLMTAIPARVAGVGEIVMTVPAPDGELSDLVLAAAHIAGVDRGFRVGGAQAIAALATGTATIPRVDKIVGPGGVFVAAAKRQVFGAVGIDMLAGPSEVLIVADGSTPVEWAVYDLFSQAEHDEAAQAILLCPDQAYLDQVHEAMSRHLASAPRREIIAAALARRGALIATRDVGEAVAIANRVAPEHLELCLAEPERWLAEVRHAGAVFVGAHSPEVMGDYTAGPSHVLPTYGSARFSSPLGVYDFQKRTSVIRLSPEGAQVLARPAALLAQGEGLAAHARAAEIRIRGIDHNEAEG